MLTKLKAKSEFSKNVLTLMTGTTIAQAIPIAISPILTRIYTPEDFGVLALFIAITSIFGSIANGRYELAIMLPKKDEDAINILALGFIINVTLSFFLLFIVLIFHDILLNLLNNNAISPWLYLVPVSVFLMGCFNLLNYFNNRKKLYKDLAKANIYKSIGMAIVQLSFGFLKAGAFGLISGSIFSQIISNMKLILNIRKLNLFKYVKKVKIVALAKRYKNFPKFSMWSAFLNTASLEVPVILLSSFFTTSIVGFYSLSYKFIAMPMGLIGSSIGQVFYQQSALIKNNKEALKKLTLKTYKKLFQIAVLPFSLIAVYGDYIFSFIFGSDWLVSGELAQILAIWILFYFIHSPLTSLFLTLEKQKEMLYFNILTLLGRILIISVISTTFKDIYLTITLYAFFGAIINISILIYFFLLLKIKIINELKYIFGVIFSVLIPLILIKGISL